MVHRDPNFRPSVAGTPIRLEARRPAALTCRDAILAALANLGERTGRSVFKVKEVYAEIVASGASYAEPTVFSRVAGGISAPGSHGSRRDSLPSPGSSHPSTSQ